MSQPGCWNSMAGASTAVRTGSAGVTEAPRGRATAGPPPAHRSEPEHPRHLPGQGVLGHRGVYLDDAQAETRSFRPETFGEQPVSSIVSGDRLTHRVSMSMAANPASNGLSATVLRRA
jgi:hypothetical protein